MVKYKQFKVPKTPHLCTSDAGKIENLPEKALLPYGIFQALVGIIRNFCFQKSRPRKYGRNSPWLRIVMQLQKCSWPKKQNKKNPNNNTTTTTTLGFLTSKITVLHAHFYLFWHTKFWKKMSPLDFLILSQE